MILAAVVILPAELGGWGSIFDAADAKFAATESATDGILLNSNNQLQYITLALGSALALFLYPHALTGVLASRGRNVIKALCRYRHNAFHLVADVIDRVPGLGVRHAALRQHMLDERLRCREHTRRFGEDAPDVACWVWPG